MTYNITTISSNPKSIDTAKSVLSAIGEKCGNSFRFDDCQIDSCGRDTTTLSAQTIESAKRAHAILFDINGKNSNAILNALGCALGLYAKVDCAKLHPALTNESPLKNELISNGVNIATVCDIANNTNSNDSGFNNNSVFGRAAYDTLKYSELEIERVARVAYELAETRRRRLTLVDKADTLISSKLWRKIVTDINEDYPFVQVEMLRADEFANRILCAHTEHDVILTSEIFGGMIVNLLATAVGNGGMNTAALFGETTLGAYGTVSNIMPRENNSTVLDMVFATAQMLRDSLDLQNEADRLDNAIMRAISDGYLTQNLTNEEMTDKIISLL